MKIRQIFDGVISTVGAVLLDLAFRVEKAYAGDTYSNVLVFVDGTLMKRNIHYTIKTHGHVVFVPFMVPYSGAIVTTVNTKTGRVRTYKVNKTGEYFSV